MLNIPPRYFSTNSGIFGTSELEKRIAIGSLQTAGLAEAIITGQAPDGGLFMPTHIPQISLETVAGMKNMSYAQVFVEAMQPFFEGTLPKETIGRIAEEAYPEKDEKSAFRPFIEKLSDIDYIGRLDEGPTFAFKDYAAQVLFRIIEALVKQDPAEADGLAKESRKKYAEAKNLGSLCLAYSAALPQIVERDINFRKGISNIDLMTFIVATSGDTGGAMGSAVLNREKMWMAILHSADIGKEISDLQAKQMDSLMGNTYALWLKTDFDGCQKIAQDLLKDQELQYMNLNSANSINIGRLLPQIAYYFYIYSKVAQQPGEQVVFSVPTGNAGDIVAGLFAIRMGLPAKVIAGVNENDVIERFYRTGLYAPAEKTLTTHSNAMDVNWPSNMRRLFQLYNGQLIEGKDPDDPERKTIERLILPDLHKIRQEIAGAYRISNKEALKEIEEFWNKEYMIGSLHSTLEPHGAVAYGAMQKFRQQTSYGGKIVAFETAHPAKFPEKLLDLGIKPVPPTSLYRLLYNPPERRHFILDADYNAVKANIVQFYHIEIAKAQQLKK